MKKDITLEKRKTLTSLCEEAKFELDNCLSKISSYYSDILEEHIDNHQTLLLINAQAAAVCTLMPLGIPILLRAAFILWFGTAVYQCRKGGL